MKDAINKTWLPQALGIGVNYNVFWQLTPRKLEPFIAAYRQKNEFEIESFREKANYTAWLQGLYVARAIAVNLSKNTQYFNEPIDFQLKDNDSSIIAAKAAKFEAWAINFNSGLSALK